MINIAKKRMLLQRLVKRANRTPADFDLAWEIADQICIICDEAEILIEQNDRANAFSLLWLVADELIVHYEIIEETAQVYESLEGWAISVTDTIEKSAITEERLQLLRKQVSSWNCEDYNLQEPLESLINMIAE